MAFIDEILYGITQNLAKLSILLFYLRLFPDNRFRNVTKVMIVLIALFAIAFNLAVIFQCWPVRRAWDQTRRGKCIRFDLLTYLGSAFSIITDFVIILLPVPQLWSLNLNYSKRIALVLMFAVGSL